MGLLHADDVFYNEHTLYNISQEFYDRNDVVYGNVLFCDKENISIITREWISSIFKKENCILVGCLRIQHFL